MNVLSLDHLQATSLLDTAAQVLMTGGFLSALPAAGRDPSARLESGLLALTGNAVALVLWNASTGPADAILRWRHAAAPLLLLAVALRYAPTIRVLPRPWLAGASTLLGLIWINAWLR